MSLVINAQPKGNWINAGTLTTAQAALTTDKSYETVYALDSTKRIIYDVEDLWITLEIRFKDAGGAGNDNNTNIIEMYALRGKNDDFYTVDTYTLLTGTQTDGTNNYIDKVTNSDPLWPSEIEIISAEDNSIARIALNTHGISKLLFIATTLASTDGLLVDIARAG